MTLMPAGDQSRASVEPEIMIQVPDLDPEIIMMCHRQCLPVTAIVNPPAGAPRPPTAALQGSGSESGPGRSSFVLSPPLRPPRGLAVAAPGGLRAAAQSFFYFGEYNLSSRKIEF